MREALRGARIYLFFKTLAERLGKLMMLFRFKNFPSSLEDFYRTGARILVHILYNVKGIGFEKIPDSGPGIIICNHISYVDGLIIHTLIPNRKIHYLIDERIFSAPGVNYFMNKAGAIPISPNRQSVERAIREIGMVLKDGGMVCVFPEGQLTYTGNMRRFRFGIEWIIKENPATIYPMALKGLWGSIFSRKYRKSRLRWLPRSLRRKITGICGEPIPADAVKVSHLQRVIMDLKNSI